MHVYMAPIGALCNPIGKWQMHVYMAPIGALCNPIGIYMQGHIHAGTYTCRKALCNPIGILATHKESHPLTISFSKS
jgi:hypothetical protein